MAEVEVHHGWNPGWDSDSVVILAPVCDEECDHLGPGLARCQRLTGHPEDEPGHHDYNRFPRGHHVALDAADQIAQAWPVKEPKPEGVRWL